MIFMTPQAATKYSRVSNNRPVIIKDPTAQKFRSGLLIDALICINRPDVNCYSGRLLEKCYYSYEVLNDPATGKYQPGRKKVSNKHRPGGKKAENLLSTRVDYSKVESICFYINGHKLHSCTQIYYQIFLIDTGNVILKKFYSENKQD